MIKKVKKELMTFLMLFFLMFVFEMTTNVYAVGPGENNKKIAVVGDSFAGYFREFIGIEGFDYHIFPVGAITQTLNVVVFVNCIEKGDNNYIMFCTGVNDYLLDTDVYEFEKFLRTYIELAQKYNKYIFFHTYMDFIDSSSHKGKAKIKDYDDIYKKLAEEYPNVFYIDMTNMFNTRYMHSDKRHYAREFYNSLYAKLKYLTDAINSTQYKYDSAWISMADNHAISVTGDSYAGTFVRYEKGKHYYLVEFAKDGQTVVQNDALMNQALDSLNKYALLSIGVNDYERQTDTFIFEDTLRRFLNHACFNHKTVFMHSYMDYGAANKLNVKIERYDNILKKLSYEYPNAIFIDMKPYELSTYQMPDKKHYGQEFNDRLYMMIDEMINKINTN